MSPETQALLQRDSLLVIWELRAVWTTICLYFLSSAFYLAWFFVPGSRVGRSASRLFVSAALIQTLIILSRTIQAGCPPYQTLYECLLCDVFCVSLITDDVECDPERLFPLQPDQPLKSLLVALTRLPDEISLINHRSSRAWMGSSLVRKTRSQRLEKNASS